MQSLEGLALNYKGLVTPDEEYTRPHRDHREFKVLMSLRSVCQYNASMGVKLIAEISV